MMDPTEAQRNTFAKMGYAMPDGSYYIRPGDEAGNDLSNAIMAVGRGEAAGDNGSAIRRHIMKRAQVLQMTDKIPNTWLPDGSLKHMDLDEFLTHHGILGMHWGHHKSREELLSEAGRHEEAANAHAKLAESYRTENEDLLKNGLQSKAFKRVYGEDAYKQSELKFQMMNGQTRAGALQETSNNLRLAHNMHARASNRLTKKVSKLREQAASMDHSDAIGEGSSLEHFGVLGMKWGHRKGRTQIVVDMHQGHGRVLRKEKLASDPASDFTEAYGIHQKAKKAGGTHALTNDELKKLNERLNLEQNYTRLTSNAEHVSAGKKAVDVSLGIGGNIAKNAVTSVGTRAATKGLEKGLKGFGIPL